MKGNYTVPDENGGQRICRVIRRNLSNEKTQQAVGDKVYYLKGILPKNSLKNALSQQVGLLNRRLMSYTQHGQNTWQHLSLIAVIQPV